MTYKQSRQNQKRLGIILTDNNFKVVNVNIFRELKEATIKELKECMMTTSH